MSTRLKSAFLMLLSVPLLSSACQGSHSPNAPSLIEPSRTASSLSETPSAATASQTQAVALAEGSSNGAAGQMPAFYEGQLFTVNMKEVPNSDPLIAKNPSVNEIYASNDLDEEQDFIPVIDAIQSEGFNPLWRQILIVFNAGFTPHQFVSEDQIDAAAAGPTPEITLVETDEVYRCSVVGRK